MHKKLLAMIVTALGLGLVPLNANAVEENVCRTFNFSDVFYFGYDRYFPTWTPIGVSKVITWKILESGELNGKSVKSGFNDQNKRWLIEAFASWDEALDTITFKEAEVNESPDIRIAWTQVLQLDYESLFTIKAPDGFRREGTIEFKHGSSFLIQRENFLQAAQSDIGHILGMGYVAPSVDIASVMEWPFQGPYGQIPLGEFDVGLIRAIYGESTCSSTFAPNIQAKIREAQEISALEKQKSEEAEKERLKVEAEERARLELYWTNIGKQKAELEAKLKNEQGNAKAAAPAKRTIVCVKGKLTKKVVAVNPKCPAGYKRA
jgi:hypothetical protein